MLKLGFEGKNGRFLCFFEAKEAVAQVVFFSVRPGPIEKSRYAAVAELFMRINCRLNVGAFEFNLDNGMARFRTGVDLEGVQDPIVVIRNIVFMNVTTMDKYAPLLEAVVKGQAPADAFQVNE